MSYLVFARKFRPQNLEELVGQEHVATTLKNALKQGRLAQSFLFSGTRGVGKTSSARILAKMLNCEKAKSGDEPCDKCTSCEEITRGTSLDVLEIDGASNRGIDEIRNLRDNVKFKPMVGKFKVYIIDEVHMLTGEAFNALLKTLEEPPSHVKFIFATTEAHKIPLTILSRCQRFHFRRIAIPKIVETLEKIGKAEKLKLDPEALFMIAKQAEGSMRDAESLLEQMVSFCGTTLKREDVEETLDLSSTTVLFSFIGAIASKDSAQVLDLIDALVTKGQDLNHFVTGLLETFRGLLLSHIMDKPEKYLELSEEGKKLIETHKAQFSKEDLFMILEALQELNWKMKRTNTQRILLEISLLALATRESMESVSSLIQEIKALRQGSAGRPAASSPAPVIPRSQQVAQPVKKNLTPKSVAQPAPVAKTAVAEPTTETTVKQQNPVSTPKKAVKQSSVELSNIEMAWQRIIEAVKAQKMSAGTFLAEAEPIEVSKNTLVIGFPSEFRFHKDALEKRENKELVEGILASATGVQLRVNYVTTKKDSLEIASTEPEEEEKSPEIINQAMEIFQGRILEKD